MRSAALADLVDVDVRPGRDLTQSGDGDLDHEIAAMEHVGEVLMDQADASSLITSFAPISGAGSSGLRPPS